MKAAGKGQASILNPNGPHSKEGRLGENTSAFLPVAQGQLPGWGDREPGTKGWELEVLWGLEGGSGAGVMRERGFRLRG